MSDDELIERVARVIADVTDFDGDRMASRYADSELRDVARAILPFIHEARIEGGKMVQEAMVGKWWSSVDFMGAFEAIHALSVEDIIKSASA